MFKVTGEVRTPKVGEWFIPINASPGPVQRTDKVPLAFDIFGTKRIILKKLTRYTVEVDEEQLGVLRMWNVSFKGVADKAVEIGN